MKCSPPWDPQSLVCDCTRGAEIDQNPRVDHKFGKYNAPMTLQLKKKKKKKGYQTINYEAIVRKWLKNAPCPQGETVLDM